MLRNLTNLLDRYFAEVQPWGHWIFICRELACWPRSWTQCCCWGTNCYVSGCCHPRPVQQHFLGIVKLVFAFKQGNGRSNKKADQENEGHWVWSGLAQWLEADQSTHWREWPLQMVPGPGQCTRMTRKWTLYSRILFPCYSFHLSHAGVLL